MRGHLSGKTGGETAYSTIRPGREALLIWVMMTLVAVASFGWIYFLTSNIQQQAIEGELTMLAEIAASVVDGDRHRQLVQPEQTGGELYRQLIAPLVTFHRASPALYYVYTVVLVDDQPHFILDTTRQIRDQRPSVPMVPSNVMEPYEVPDPAMLYALENAVLTVGELHSDEFGTFVSAFAPFYDSNHEPVGIVGVDLSVGAYMARIAKVLRACLYGLAVSLALAVLLALLTYRARTASYQRELEHQLERQEKERELALQNQENERLLANILPAPIAHRLKSGEELIADAHELVTVIFIDMTGFTRYSANHPARRVVDTLNRIFRMIDDLTIKYRLEKIKTIGDAYMMVGGLDPMDDDHPRRVADMALELVREFDRIKQELQVTDFNFRVGIATGPVVSGVIGSVKFAYDLWGDTVNAANRLESSSLPGRIHCNARFAHLLQEDYRFADRGEIELKGKGAMHTYFLLGQGEGATPEISD
ncbi:MAG: adenylate/guanylate cyclase domain-containing protein [Desulfurivibrio sp.]|nr:adenylate/guanylate cyclase domain-containing protein [Desulfurivibrio sp.]